MEKEKPPRVIFEGYQAGFMMHKASESPLAHVARYIQKERKEIEELKQKLFEMKIQKIIKEKNLNQLLK